jgi:hypothetical protein
MIPNSIFSEINSIVTSAGNNALVNADLHPHVMFWWKLSKSNSFSSGRTCTGGSSRPVNLQLILVLMHLQFGLYGSAEDVPDAYFNVTRQLLLSCFDY